jgi:hypothetical protein
MFTDSVFWGGILRINFCMRNHFGAWAGGCVDMWALEMARRKGIDECTDYAFGVNSDRFKVYSHRSSRFESFPLHEL